jgi:site-specific recombinase XerD
MAGTRRKPGALAPFVVGYRDWLLERGYSPVTVVKSLIALGHLGRWMDHNGIGVERLDDGAVRSFLAGQARTRAGRLPLASVQPLIAYLRAEGVVAPEPPGTLTAVDELIAGYRSWLSFERGLAPETVRGNVELARRFLPGVSVGLITGGDVTAFLLAECERVSSASAGVAVYRLRSLLRYLAVCDLAEPGLAAAVPTVARWRDAYVPRFSPAVEIDRLLASVDRSSLVGARDYAILLLLARLGLRAIEVARLRLDDLDWRAGEITVDGKGHHRERLPLPDDVGGALVAYLQKRGEGALRWVFLTPRAPIRPIEASGVRTVVRRAYRRAGLAPVGAHQLRHALARNLVREGASLIAVGQILRHRHLESTRIYAKVDFERLGLAARPWPDLAR